MKKKAGGSRSFGDIDKKDVSVRGPVPKKSEALVTVTCKKCGAPSQLKAGTNGHCAYCGSQIRA